MARKDFCAIINRVCNIMEISTLSLDEIGFYKLKVLLSVVVSI